jgi:hypothetical protein
MERELSLFEHPIATVSFFSGNYQAAASHLKDRIANIITLNPWCWLIKDGDDKKELKVFYDHLGNDRCEGYLEVYEPFVIGLSQSSMQYQEVPKNLLAIGAIVPSNCELIGKNKPFGKCL